MNDFDELLDESSLPEEQMEICFRSDLVKEYRKLRSEQAEQTEDSLAAGGSSDAMRALEERIRKATITFVIRALPRNEYTALLAKHQAKQKPSDRQNPFQMNDFMVELLRRCTVSPPMTDDRWDKLEKKLTTGQWEKLHAIVYAVNSTEVNLPF